MNMYNFKFFLSVGAAVVLIFPMENDVMAAPAPAPHPCLWTLDYNRDHPKPTTTTAKPSVVEDFAKLSNKKTSKLEKLLRGPNIEDMKPHSRNALDRMISGYMKFLSNILKMF